MSINCNSNKQQDDNDHHTSIYRWTYLSVNAKIISALKPKQKLTPSSTVMIKIKDDRPRTATGLQFIQDTIPWSKLLPPCQCLQIITQESLNTFTLNKIIHQPVSFRPIKLGPQWRPSSTFLCKNHSHIHCRNHIWIPKTKKGKWIWVNLLNQGGN